MRIKGLLFDKDGTLIDFNHTWLPLYQRAAEYLAEQSHRDIDPAQLLHAGGYRHATNSWLPDSLLAAGSNNQIHAHWQELTGLVIEGEILGRLDRIFSAESHSYQSVVPEPGAWLAALQRSGYKLGVATMDDEDHARHALDALGIAEHIDFFCGADSGFGVKPEPGMLEAFCRACSLQAAEVAMIGDSPRDLQMATNAGSQWAIGVLTGASTRKSLDPHASHVLPSIVELPALLSTLQQSS